MTFHCHKLQTSSSVTFNLANYLHVFPQSALFNTRKIKFLFTCSFLFYFIFFSENISLTVNYTLDTSYKITEVQRIKK